MNLQFVQQSGIAFSCDRPYNFNYSMRKQTVSFIGLWVFVLIAAGVAGFVLLSGGDDTETVTSSESSNSTTQAGTITTFNSNENQTETTPLEVTQPNNNTTTLGASNTQTQTLGEQSNAESQETSVPGPETFSQYEEYANNDTALFADIIEGDGAVAEPGSNVAVFYQGWLTNGELFDQSRTDESGTVQPFIFQIGSGQVIPGWDQTIAGMKEGGVRRLIIPSALAYGSTGQGSIPPDSMLIFDVQLQAVQ